MAETADERAQRREAGDEPPERRPGSWTRLGLRLFGGLTSALLRALGTSWRFEIRGPDPRSHKRGDRPHLAALYHESMLPSLFAFRDRSYSVAISRSRDGDLVAAALRRLGYASPVRGSSSKGGTAALLGLVRMLEEGTTVGILVDGPRGPARAPKAGVLSVARLSGIRIQPVAFAARPALRIRSWDRSLIPLPFARVLCLFGEALEIDPMLDDAKEEDQLALLNDVLRTLQIRAEKTLGIIDREDTPSI